MRVLTKCDGPVSAFEVYQVVAEELSRIPLKDSLLTEDQLRRKFCYLAVLEQIERHSAVPSIEQLDVTTEGKNALEFHAAGATASTIVSKQNLEALLDKLNRQVFHYRVSPFSIFLRCHVFVAATLVCPNRSYFKSLTLLL